MDNNSNIVESLLIDSRITPIGNGTRSDNDGQIGSQTTGGQKWWAAVILGFIFFLISSSVAYSITSEVTLSTVGTPLLYGTGPTLAGLLLHTLIFILIVRVILW